MPRAGWVKPQTDQRLSDHISLGVLTRTFPPELVDRVVAETGSGEQRHRLLPARVVVYYVLAMALFSRESYEEVMRLLVEGLSWSTGWRQRWEVPTKAAIFKARTRLGSEPLERLFGEVAVPLATSGTHGAWLEGWRLMSIDGTTLDLADTADNDRHFGRPGSGRGERSAWPQLRMVGVAESGTHAIVDAALGPYTTSEASLARGLFSSLVPGMLVIADRGFYGFDAWNAAKQTGADLLWRVKSNLKLAVDERLGDGSYLSRIHHPGRDRARRNGQTVRVVDYHLDDPALGDERYRLVTTILDPDAASAEALVPAYHSRWEFETALDELKTHQRGPGLVLRSKKPDGVYQEAYGYLCLHYAIRALMHGTAADADVDPDRLSFTRALRAARRTTRTHPGFSPHSTG